MGDDRHLDEPRRTDGADGPASDRSAVLVGAVWAVAAPVAVTLLYVATATLVQQGPIAALRALGQDPMALAIVATVAMTVVGVVGVPLALLVERLLRERPRARWLTYGSAGAVGGATVGGLLTGPSPWALLLVAYGTVSGLGGAAGLGWARRRPEARNRRLGRRAAAGAGALALAAWLITGAVLVPLLTGGVAAVAALLVLRRPGDGAAEGGGPAAVDRTRSTGP